MAVLEYPPFGTKTALARSTQFGVEQLNMGSIKRRPYQPAKPKNLSGLDGLAFDELIALKEQVEATLLERVAAEREAVKAKLAQLEQFTRSIGGQDSSPTRSRGRAKPAPKYRNPITGETWAGRGLRPRWMVKAIQAGASADEFLIQ